MIKVMSLAISSLSLLSAFHNALFSWIISSEPHQCSALLQPSCRLGCISCENTAAVVQNLPKRPKFHLSAAAPCLLIWVFGGVRWHWGLQAPQCRNTATEILHSNFRADEKAYSGENGNVTVIAFLNKKGNENEGAAVFIWGAPIPDCQSLTGALPAFVQVSSGWWHLQI